MTPGLNLDLPEDRAAFIERHGIDAYERAIREHQAKQVITTVNGRAVRAVMSQRFGRIFMVDGLNRGHATLEGAVRIAEGKD